MQARWLGAVVFVIGCSHAAPSTGGSGGGAVESGTTPPVAKVELPTGPITSCESAKPKIEALYRADADATMPGADKVGKRAEIVADNTQMVLNDCAKTTSTAVPCLDRVTTVADMEAKCLIPIDDEGTEGDALKAAKLKEQGK